MAITLYPFVLATKSEKQDTVLMNHEKIHLAQQKELFLIFYIAIHILTFIWYTIRYLSMPKGYTNIPFEKEAYEHENDFEYLKNRKRFAWFRK